MSSRVYAHVGALAATGNALTLEKALRQRMWPGSREECRQLPNIGKLLGSRLAANGMGSLLALQDTDPRKVEAVTQRNYPFGKNLHLSDHLSSVKLMATFIFSEVARSQVRESVTLFTLFENLLSAMRLLLPCR